MSHLTTLFVVGPEEYVEFNESLGSKAMLQHVWDHETTPLDKKDTASTTLHSSGARISPTPPPKIEFPTLKRIKGKGNHYQPTGKWFSWEELARRNPLAVNPPPSIESLRKQNRNQKPQGGSSSGGRGDKKDEGGEKATPIDLGIGDAPRVQPGSWLVEKEKKPTLNSDSSRSIGTSSSKYATAPLTSALNGSGASKYGASAVETANPDADSNKAQSTSNHFSPNTTSQESNKKVKPSSTSASSNSNSSSGGSSSIDALLQRVRMYSRSGNSNAPIPSSTISTSTATSTSTSTPAPSTNSSTNSQFKPKSIDNSTEESSFADNPDQPPIPSLAFSLGSKLNDTESESDEPQNLSSSSPSVPQRPSGPKTLRSDQKQKTEPESKKGEVLARTTTTSSASSSSAQASKSTNSSKPNSNSRKGIGAKGSTFKEELDPFRAPIGSGSGSGSSNSKTPSKIPQAPNETLTPGTNLDLGSHSSRWAHDDQPSFKPIEQKKLDLMLSKASLSQPSTTTSTSTTTTPTTASSSSPFSVSKSASTSQSPHTSTSTPPTSKSEQSKPDNSLPPDTPKGPAAMRNKNQNQSFKPGSGDAEDGSKKSGKEKKVGKKERQTEKEKDKEKDKREKASKSDKGKETTKEQEQKKDGGDSKGAAQSGKSERGNPSRGSETETKTEIESLAISNSNSSLPSTSTSSFKNTGAPIEGKSSTHSQVSNAETVKDKDLSKEKNRNEKKIADSSKFSLTPSKSSELGNSASTLPICTLSKSDADAAAHTGAGADADAVHEETVPSKDKANMGSLPPDQSSNSITSSTSSKGASAAAPIPESTTGADAGGVGLSSSTSSQSLGFNSNLNWADDDDDDDTLPDLEDWGISGINSLTSPSSSSSSQAAARHENKGQNRNGPSKLAGVRNRDGKDKLAANEKANANGNGNGNGAAMARQDLDGRTDPQSQSQFSHFNPNVNGDPKSNGDGKSDWESIKNVNKRGSKRAGKGRGSKKDRGDNHANRDEASHTSSKNATNNLDSASSSMGMRIAGRASTTSTSIENPSTLNPSVPSGALRSTNPSTTFSRSQMLNQPLNRGNKAGTELLSQSPTSSASAITPSKPTLSRDSNPSSTKKPTDRSQIHHSRPRIMATSGGAFSRLTKGIVAINEGKDEKATR